MDEQSTNGCIARTAGGDMQALHELYTAYKGAVFALSLAILQDRGLAEDALQETFVKVCRNAGRYRPGGNPRAWILAVARNAALTMLRKRKHESLEMPDEPEDPKSGGSDSLALKLAMESLSRTEREIVTLHALSGFTHREIAKILGIPAGSVSWRAKRATEKLKEKLL